MHVDCIEKTSYFDTEPEIRYSDSSHIVGTRFAPFRASPRLLCDRDQMTAPDKRFGLDSA